MPGSRREHQRESLLGDWENLSKVAESKCTERMVELENPKEQDALGPKEAWSSLEGWG